MDNNIHHEIVASLESVADPAHAAKDKRYHKYDSYKSYGIKSPDLSRLLKRYKKEVGALACEVALTAAHKLYSSGIEEQLMAGNYILTLKKECLTLPRQAAYLDRLADNFMSWSTVDDFCIDVLQPLLMQEDGEALILLRNWNKSSSLWKRRASVVTFTRKVGESGKFTQEVIDLCENLKSAPEDLVRKGVGWALKDAMRGDKQKVLAYVRQLRREGAPATITLYAIRDLKGKEREDFLSIKTD